MKKWREEWKPEDTTKAVRFSPSPARTQHFATVLTHKWRHKRDKKKKKKSRMRSQKSEKNKKKWKFPETEPKINLLLKTVLNS